MAERICIYTEGRIGGFVAYSPDVWMVTEGKTAEDAARKLADSYGKSALVKRSTTQDAVLARRYGKDVGTKCEFAAL